LYANVPSTKYLLYWKREGHSIDFGL
jgi:hypothetical protein